MKAYLQRLAEIDLIRFVVIAMQLCVACAAEVFLGPFTASAEPWAAAARIGAVFLTFFMIHTFGLRALRTFGERPLSNVICLYGALFATVVLANLCRIFGLGLETYLARVFPGTELSAQSLFFIVPFPAGALVLQAILGLHFGLIFSLAIAAVFSLYAGPDFLAAPYVFCTCAVACLTLTRFRSRSAYLRTGLTVAITAAPLALGSLLLVEDPRVSDVLMRLIGSLLCGVLSSFLAAGCTPVVENVFGFSTDLRLIEMATLDHPLLKELSIQAPGTWNHSMVMGMMVESAADAVGANSVVCRVGAYFHDIGKMNKPLYFVENQNPGENRHDKLSPSMSALIIKSHVKEGIELARAHKVPKVIEEMIPQHHGTSVIEFFYEKARRESEEAGEDPELVEIASYSYPGPRPQTREAGILMLADGIEAAARTLSEPSFDRIQGMVQKMINKVFASGELEECELTLKDLHLIAKCFTRVLTGIYHQRIAYAEPAEKVNERTKATGKEDEVVAEEAQKTGNQEDLKRLGIRG